MSLFFTLCLIYARIFRNILHRWCRETQFTYDLSINFVHLLFFCIILNITSKALERRLWNWPFSHWRVRFTVNQGTEYARFCETHFTISQRCRETFLCARAWASTGLNFSSYTRTPNVLRGYFDQASRLLKISYLSRDFRYVESRLHQNNTFFPPRNVSTALILGTLMKFKRCVKIFALLVCICMSNTSPLCHQWWLSSQHTPSLQQELASNRKISTRCLSREDKSVENRSVNERYHVHWFQPNMYVWRGTRMSNSVRYLASGFILILWRVFVCPHAQEFASG